MLKRITLYVACLAVMAGPALAGSIIIQPHRAVYDLTLKKLNDRAGLSSVEGRMAIEIGGSSCDGYTVNFRMVNRFKPTDGEVRTVDTRSATWESGDGMTLRYNQSEFVQNKQDTETKLSASRDAQGGPGKGHIDVPKPEDFSLPSEAVFPMAHQLRLMAAAERGEGRDASVVFDGSDGGKSYRAITFIGAKQDGLPVPIDNESGRELAKLPSWAMSVSYYPVKPADDAIGDTPTYQVSFQMYENGVASSVLLDYGDFSVAGKLRNLDYLGKPGC